MKEIAQAIADLIRKLGTLAETHFELCILLIIFIFGTFMLARYPMHEEMARWIEGGVAVGAVATVVSGRAVRAAGNAGSNDKPPETKGKTE